MGVKRRSCGCIIHVCYTGQLHCSIEFRLGGGEDKLKFVFSVEKDENWFKMCVLIFRSKFNGRNCKQNGNLYPPNVDYQIKVPSIINTRVAFMEDPLIYRKQIQTL